MDTSKGPQIRLGGTFEGRGQLRKDRTRAEGTGGLPRDAQRDNQSSGGTHLGTRKDPEGQNQGRVMALALALATSLVTEKMSKRK